MNIFFLDYDPRIAATYMVNGHVRSQIKESVQLLSTAHYVCGMDELCVVPPTHKHHPITKWVMKNQANYRWLWEHLKALLDEYQYRHGVPHHYSQYLDKLENVPGDIPYNTHRPTCPPAVVTEDLKPKSNNNWDELIAAYKAYYDRDKRHLHNWMARPKPDWITEPKPVRQNWDFDPKRWQASQKARRERRNAA